MQLRIGNFTYCDDGKLFFLVPPVLMACEKPMFGISPDNLWPLLKDRHLLQVGVVQNQRDAEKRRVECFQEAFVYSLFARYLLIKWKSNTKEGWVPLADVLAGAINDGGACSKLEVNFADGVAQPKGSGCSKGIPIDTASWKLSVAQSEPGRFPTARELGKQQCQNSSRCSFVYVHRLSAVTRK